MNKQKNLENINSKDTVRVALREMQAALKEVYGSNTPEMLLYGSQARGEAKETSDIDIALLYPHDIQPGQEIRRISSILADLNLRHQVLVSVLPTSKEDYKKSTGILWNNIRNEGISIDAI
ncbi:MAG: hypothetical protein MAG431_02313 [Chloroflexi bacterium]|nr:hypothetical protein [Chloroflexota bacterium]